MINWGALVLLGYDPGAEENRVEIITGSGIEYVPSIVLKRIEALDHHRESFAVLCHTLPQGATVDGVLGLDFFRKRKLTIDFIQGSVDMDGQGRAGSATRHKTQGTRH